MTWFDKTVPVIGEVLVMSFKLVNMSTIARNEGLLKHDKTNAPKVRVWSCRIYLIVANILPLLELFHFIIVQKNKILKN